MEKITPALCRKALFVALSTLALTACNSLTTQSGLGTLAPIEVSEADLADCPELAKLRSNLANDVTPFAVDTVALYNECAAGKQTLADKVRAHNKKSEKNKNEKALGEGS